MLLSYSTFSLSDALKLYFKRSSPVISRNEHTGNKVQPLNATNTAAKIFMYLIHKTTKMFTQN